MAGGRVLRIGVDVTAAVTGGTGIARYVTEVADAIEAAGASGEAADVARFALGRGVRPAPPGTRHVRVPLRVLDRAWRHTRRPRLERLVQGMTSVHASGPVLPPTALPLVGIVYDLAPILRPDLHPPRDVDQLRRYVAALDRADATVTISEATADRLRAQGADADRIHVIPIGLSRFPEPIPPPLADRPYVLAVGAPVLRKGFDVLLRAVARLDDPDVAVAVVGPPGPEDAALAALAAQLGLDGRYHRPGGVSLGALAGWYSSAAAVAAPSIDEGFGLPLIEAMSCGAPVVATDIEPFREVAAEHARLVPVGDERALAQALEEAIDRPAGTDGRMAAARAHARGFSWERCAAATVAVHRAVSAA